MVDATWAPSSRRAIFIVYQTAFLDSQGRLAFVPDVYRRDDEIWQHLHPLQTAVAQREQVAERGG